MRRALLTISTMIGLFACMSSATLRVAIAEKLNLRTEELPHFRSAPSALGLISLGLSTGRLLYISPRAVGQQLELLPVKEGVLVAAVLDQDPKSWSDRRKTEEVLRTISEHPGRVLLSDRPSTEVKTVALPDPVGSVAYLMCLSLDSNSVNGLDRKKAIALIRHDLRNGSLDVIGPVSIDLRTKHVDLQ